MTNECKHEGKTDLTHGKGETRNYYCPDCKSHWYNDEYFTAIDWERYVNSD